MNVEDLASEISVIFGIQHDWRDQISGIHVSPGSAETLARGGGITNHHAGGNYSRPHSLAVVGDYRRRIYAIYVGGT